MEKPAFATISALALAFAGLLAGCTGSSPSPSEDRTGHDLSEMSPSITFSKESHETRPGGTLTIVAVNGASRPLPWTDIAIHGDGSCTLPTGTIDPDDVIQCSTDGPHHIHYLPRDALLYTAHF